MNIVKEGYAVLKAWDEINKKYPYFINEDNLDCKEIYIEENNFYIGEEYRSILGKKVKLVLMCRTTDADDIYWTSQGGGYMITKFMIKREATYELDPECFV